MKKTLLALSLIGASAAVIAQSNTQSYMSDGRIAAKDMDAEVVTTPALPIRQTYVPEEVVNNLTSTYGSALYSVAQVKSASGEMVYKATVIDNGVARAEWVSENGDMVANVFRQSDNDEMAAGTNKSRNNADNNTATVADETGSTVTGTEGNTLDANTDANALTGNTSNAEATGTTDNNALDNTGTTDNGTGNDSQMNSNGVNMDAIKEDTNTEVTTEEDAGATNLNTDTDVNTSTTTENASGAGSMDATNNNTNNLNTTNTNTDTNTNSSTTNSGVNQ